MNVYAWLVSKASTCCSLPILRHHCLNHYWLNDMSFLFKDLRSRKLGTYEISHNPSFQLSSSPIGGSFFTSDIS